MTKASFDAYLPTFIIHSCNDDALGNVGAERLMVLNIAWNS